MTLCCPVCLLVGIVHNKGLWKKNLCLSLPFLDCIVMFLFLSVRKSSAQMQVLVEEPHHVVRIFGNK